MTLFDKKKEYNEYVAPLIEQLKMRCEAHDIPMYVSCCIRSKENETEYVSDAVCTGSKNVELFDDQIEKHLCVSNGFLVSPPGFQDDMPSSFLEYMDEIELQIKDEKPVEENE